MSTSRVEVGTPSVSLSGWTTTEVSFHGFADLPTTKENENKVSSQEFSCFGHLWAIGLYPGGRTTSDDGFLTVEFAHKSTSSINIKYGYSVRGADGKEVVYKSFTNEFAAKGCQAPKYNAWCTINFAKRTKLMELLVNGSLVIELRMKPTGKTITQFIPTNPINKNVLELFMNEESADVVFEVGGQQQTKGKCKKAKIATTDFHAHRNILKKCAPTLYEMCGVVDRGEITTVSITDVKPEVFKHMVYYAYGGKLSDKDLKNNAKDIINSCDKYGVVHLKLEAEATYVESNEITMENMMDNLLFADSKNLALLKEAVMDFILANKGDIIGKVSFDCVPSSMITDVLTAVARGEETGGEGDSTDYNKMRVGALRKMLDDKGLDVDGSREAMIALLKENNA